jgi:hypothetical protein
MRKIWAAAAAVYSSSSTGAVVPMVLWRLREARREAPSYVPRTARPRLHALLRFAFCRCTISRSTPVRGKTASSSLKRPNKLYTPALPAPLSGSRGVGMRQWCRGEEWVDLYLHPACMPSWRGQGQLYLLYLAFNFLWLIAFIYLVVLFYPLCLRFPPPVCPSFAVIVYFPGSFSACAQTSVAQMRPLALPCLYIGSRQAQNHWINAVLVLSVVTLTPLVAWTYSGALCDSGYVGPQNVRWGAERHLLILSRAEVISNIKV